MVVDRSGPAAVLRLFPFIVEGDEFVVFGKWSFDAPDFLWELVVLEDGGKLVEENGEINGFLYRPAEFVLWLGEWKGHLRGEGFSNPREAMGADVDLGRLGIFDLSGEEGILCGGADGKKAAASPMSFADH